MSKIQNIKQHIKRNQTIYIVAGTVVTAAGCVYVGYRVGVKNSPVIEQQIKSKNQNIGLIWKPQQTIEVHIEALGDPGNIIQDLTTGTVYASQNQAAKALDVNPARITEHLQGKIPNVQGHELVKLGKAFVADEAA